MKLKAKKKLSLRSETLRNLDPQKLRLVAGGCSGPTMDIYDCRWYTFTEL